MTPRRWTEAAVAAALLVSACSSSSTLPAPASAAAAVSWTLLRARALPAPPKADLAACLLTPAFVSSRGAPQQMFAMFPVRKADRFLAVEGPASLSAGELQKLVLRSDSYAGQALVRVRRVGAGEDAAVGPAPEAMAGELQAEFSPGSASVLLVRPPAAGCYAIQVDAPAFTEVVLFEAGQPATPGPQPVDVTAAGVAAFLRSRVTGVHPVLLPSVPDGWKARVTAEPDSFTVEYDAPDGRQLVLATLVPNPPPLTTQRQPNFRGDPRSLYEWYDAQDPRAQRVLLWTEPHSRWEGQPAHPDGVMYFAVARGFTDQEFWTLMSTLAATAG